MSQELKPYIVDDYEITPHSIIAAVQDGDLTKDEAAEWIEKLYAHRRAQSAGEAEPVASIRVLVKDGERRAILLDWEHGLDHVVDGEHLVYAAPPAAANQAGKTNCYPADSHDPESHALGGGDE